jgi:AcrR family transcriptional regulator
MRKLGQELQVEAMSLYNHGRNKNDILDGMVDMIFGEIDLPVDEADWKTAMRRWAISAHHTLLRHPWAVGLMESRIQAGPVTLHHHDSVIGYFRRAGFTIDLAAHAFSVLDSYIYGFTLQRLTLPLHTPEETSQVAANVLQRLPTTEYPYPTEMIVEHAMQTGYDYGDEFGFGLDLILDSLDRAQKWPDAT